ncbi:hypothetical protein J6590_030661 [Homalodisca vitripennis]|nr:hypothetical protein J6590_030661 [Homalodisca vitripennis]
MRNIEPATGSRAGAPKAVVLKPQSQVTPQASPSNVTLNALETVDVVIFLWLPLISSIFQDFQVEGLINYDLGAVLTQSFSSP